MARGYGAVHHWPKCGSIRRTRCAFLRALLILGDADHLVAVWNERQSKRMPMLFSPTIGAAITAG
jgi:hypothetical protein